MKNKNVIIVGGSRGIGEGLVSKFINLDANVYYFSRNRSKNKFVRDNSMHINVDLKSIKNIMEGFKIYDKNNSKLDFLINVAGINYCKNHQEISLDEFDEVLNINLRSFFVTCKEAIKRMKSGAKIINVSSIAGRNKSIVSGVHYTSSKAAIIGLTRQLAHEIGSKGININCVCPSQTVTDMLKESMSEKEMEKLANNIPLKRLATIEEIVDPIIFLCSDESSYIHGACLDINGGQL